MKKGIKKPHKKNSVGRIIPARLKKAIKGSCGIRHRIAERLGCAYATLDRALQMEGDDWEECRNLLKAEREKVGDIAEITVCESMQQRVDIGVASTTARWYLDRKHADRGYGKKEQLTLEGGQNPISINHTLIPIAALNLSLETKREILKAMEAWERTKAKEDETGTE